MLWSQLVELLRAGIFGVAPLCNGSLGTAIFLVSLLLRVALLPLTLRLARRQRRQRALLATLKPELDRLRKRHASDPVRLWRETVALQRQHGYRPLDPAGLLGALVQMPVLGALVSALRRGMGKGVRFLWVADLSRADVLLSVALAAVAYVSAQSALPAASPKGAASFLPVAASLLTLAFLLSSSSAVAVSFGASSVVSAIQAWLLRRDARSGVTA